MIDDYFENLEKTVLDFKRIIKSYSIYKKAYNDKQGFIKGDIIFVNKSQLLFTFFLLPFYQYDFLD